MSIKLMLMLAVITLLLALTLAARAEQNMSSLIFGTSINGMRDVTKQDVELAFNNGISKYSNQYGINTKIKVFDTKQELMEAFDQGKVDGIFGMPTLILSRMDQLRETMVASVYLNGQYKFKYLLLVRKTDNISSIEQLQGKRISFVQSHELESLYLNTLLLRNKQAEFPQFFSEVIDAASSNVAISDVFFGRADAAILNENEYNTALELNPQIGKKTMILAQSEPMVLLAAVTRKSVPAELDDRAYQAEIEFEQSETGRSAFKLAGMQGFKKIIVQELDTVRALKDEYAQLKSVTSLKTEPKSALSNKRKAPQISKTSQILKSSRDKTPRNKQPSGL